MLLFLVAWLAAAVPAAKTSTLVATIDGVQGDVAVTLQRLGDDGRRVDVAHRQAAKSVQFDDLESGTYVVSVRGGGPLAVAATKLNLGGGERRRVTMAIHPVPLDWSVSFAGRPLAGTKLAFTNLTTQWRAEATTDAAGRVAAELWQPGQVLVTASGGALKASFSDTVELRGGHFDFVVPDRQVRGRIVDASSGRGVPRALVFLRTSHGEMKSNPRTTTDADGAFLFNAVAPGAQHLTVLAADYLIPDAVDFTTKEGDPPRQVDVVLDTGAPRALRVVMHDGRPAAGAELDAAVGGEIRAITYTNPDGRANVPLPRGGEAKVFVVPREGAFAVVGARDADRVTLPPASSSLRIVARSTDGEPLPNVELLMAFNGAVVPPAVARRLATVQGLKLITNGDGEAVLRNIPPGWYQFWPYRGEEEVQAILASSLLDAPIALNVKTGENVVAVDFQKRIR
jgi:Carboxypeptidase regulatory-like domain